MTLLLCRVLGCVEDRGAIKTRRGRAGDLDWGSAVGVCARAPVTGCRRAKAGTCRHGLSAFVTAPPGFGLVQSPNRAHAIEHRGQVASGLRTFGAVLFQACENGMLKRVRDRFAESPRRRIGDRANVLLAQFA